MATYVLVPGADGSAWSWHRVAPLLRAAGHRVVAPDLPAHESADLDDFADAITAAVRGQGAGAEPGTGAGAGSGAGAGAGAGAGLGPETVAGPEPGAAAGSEPGSGGGPLVVVAHSLGGFSAPLVCGRLPVDLLVLVNAMVPAPGETAGEWWDDTGQVAAREEYAAALGRTGADAAFDVRTDFFHDVPDDVTREAMAAAPAGPPAGVFAQPWPLAAWPEVPTRFLQGRDDRFFPLEFQRKVVRERLGLDVEELPGGHLVALARPRELAAALLRHLPVSGRSM
jgi:pimeloyl-ACP methyl ester carboxylesterase